MKPYYERNGITIYHADCRDVLPTLDTDSAALTLTDPPYGIGRIEWDDSAEKVALAEWASDWLRISPHAMFTWIARDVHNLGMMLAGSAQIYRVLVWHKPMVLNGGRANFTWHWEPVVFIGRSGTKAPGKPYYRPDVIVANPPAFKVNPENVAHNSQKPLALLRHLIEPITNHGDVVLDPFAGSGSTLVAAKHLGRRAIGVEIEERYCEIAAKRLSQDVLPLFATA